MAAITTLADLQDWRVTFTMRAGSARRIFVVTLPAANESDARDGAYGLAYAINEACRHVWKMTDEVTVDQASPAQLACPTCKSTDRAERRFVGCGFKCDDPSRWHEAGER
jgi:hypothetical protein